ncbi:hypothetical protein [Arthrobacter sp. H14-L1]|nr:hypothetical protein [Arthrobacter sp. H14-L1]
MRCDLLHTEPSEYQLRAALSVAHVGNRTPSSSLATGLMSN